MMSMDKIWKCWWNILEIPLKIANLPVKTPLQTDTVC